EEAKPEEFAVSEEALESLRKRLAWEYPFASATKNPAKTSVTVLRRQAAEEADDAASRFVWRSRAGRVALANELEKPEAVRGEDLGKAHHLFLQHFSLAGGVGAQE